MDLSKEYLTQLLEACFVRETYFEAADWIMDLAVARPEAVRPSYRVESPFVPTTVRLAETPARWRWQSQWAFVAIHIGKSKFWNLEFLKCQLIGEFPGRSC
jgi:hypothetical protein